MNVKLEARLFAGAVHFAGAALLAFAAGCAQEDAGTLLTKATAAIEKKEFRTAEIHLKNLLQMQNDPRARLLLARTYAQRTDWASAQKEYRRALEAGVDVNLVGPGLLEAMFRAGEIGKILEEAKSFEASAASLEASDLIAQAQIQLWTGRAQMSQGAPEKARTAYSKALELNPKDKRARVGLLEIAANQSVEARTSVLAAVDGLLAASPEFHDALMLQAALRYAKGDLSGAGASLEAVITQAPNDFQARSMQIEIEIAARSLERARSLLAELLKRAPGWPIALAQKARLDLIEGKHESARDTALEALKTAPGYPPALSVAGAALLAMGSLEQAETYARQVIEAAPAISNGHRLLAATLLKRGASDAALRVVTPLLEANPRDGQLLVLAGEAALRNGNARDAEAYFGRATKVDKERPGAHLGLALARIGTGNRSGALTELEAASALGADSIAADQFLVASAINDRQFDRALQAISVIEKKQPGSAEAIYLRGRVAMAQGDISGARSQYEKALRTDPASLPAATLLAALDSKEGKADVARGRFETLVKNNPASSLAALGLAKLTTDAGGSPQESLELLERARDLDPSSEAAALALAEALIQQNQLREALKTLQRAVALSPESTRLLEALATTHVRANEPERAHELIARIAKLKPDDPAIQFRLGLLKSTLRDFGGALERFSRAQELRPQSIEPKVSVAMTQARLGRFDEATNIARGLQKDHAKLPVGWALEGEILRGRQQWPAAARSFRKALELDPSQQDNALKLHDSLSRAGSGDEAQRLLAGWLQKAPDDLKLNLYAGERALLAGRFAESTEYYRTVVREAPDNAAAYNNLAWAMHQLKDDKALENAEKAFKLAPKSPAVMDTLATILLDDKQGPRALKLLQQAAALAPTAADLRLKYANALKNYGDKAEAQRELDAVVRDFPGTPQADTAARLRAEL